MLNALLISFAFPAVGLGLAAWAYPWRRPRLTPYLWFVLGLASPALAIMALMAAFGLPAGSCVQRPLNSVPLYLAGADVVAAFGLAAFAKGYRRFALGASLAICPIIGAFAFIGAMNLAGCWI